MKAEREFSKETQRKSTLLVCAFSVYLNGRAEDLFRVRSDNDPSHRFRLFDNIRSRGPS